MPDNFIQGVKQIVNGDNYSINKSFNKKYKNIEVAYFLRDIHRIINKNQWFDIYRWLFNINGYWKYIPLYDIKLFHKTIIWIRKIFVAKIKSSLISK
jgi:hypothetical protein